MSGTDRIEQKVVLPVPRLRAWEAIGNSTEFGTWFRCRFEGPFEARRWLGAVLTEPEWDGIPFVVHVERVEPGRHLSFRWHADDVDLEGDYTDEPTTLVSFDLEDVPEGTLLVIAEAGFEGLPGDVGPAARERNAKGWAIQADRVREHVVGTS